MSDASPRPAALDLLLMGASAVVVIAGAQAAAQIILPALFSAFLAILCQPAVHWLVSRRFPRIVAVFVVMVVATGLLVGATALLGDSVARFTERFPAYREPFLEVIANLTARLKSVGVAKLPDIASLFDPDVVVGVVGQTLGAVVAVLSRLLLIVITTSFILLESVELGAKMKVAFADRIAVVSSLTEGAGTVQRYLAIKTAASLATGLLVGVINFAIGLDFYVLWGVIAFLLNYIPSIGSIVAAVPAVALALVQLGPGWAVFVAAAYLAVNLTIGNFIEPRILGRRLGLSPLVVILSLFFWGWVWGPAGMLLGVPMTVVVKLLLELSPDTRWLGVLLGPVRDAEDVAVDA